MKISRKFVIVVVVSTIVVSSLNNMYNQPPHQPIQYQIVQNSANPTPTGTTGKAGKPAPGAGQRLFTLVNHWNQTIWVEASTSVGDYPPLTTTHWLLPVGSSVSTSVPDHWNGRFWGDTACATDSNGQPTSCATGHCAPYTACENGAASFATLAEFNLQHPGADDFYDVSLVDGYNLPMYINNSGGATPDQISANGCIGAPWYPGGATCVTDVNTLCANALYSQLQVKDAGGKVIACKSACTMFVGEGHAPDDAVAAPYCCPGASAYGTAATCLPASWPTDIDSAKIFKQGEPLAYSYTFNDNQSTLACDGACNYQITFGVSD